MSGDKVGGILVRAGGQLRFLPATVTVRVAPPPRLTAVPGSPPELVGVALHEGAILPVLAIGSAPGPMIVCSHSGELVGLVGGDVVRTGTFERAPAPDGLAIDHLGERVPALDLAGLYERIQKQSRAGRWV